MTRNRIRASVGVAAAVLTMSGLAALAPAGGAFGTSCDSGGGTGGGTAVSGSGCTSARYMNMFKHQSWYAGRIDMGVDYMPKKRYPVRAIGKAKVLGSDSHSGWPGGTFIWYKLLRGDHKGNVIFVAETMKRLVPAGRRVERGDRIATALPTGTGIEIGWANKRGEARAAPCYSEGMVTHSGKEMARFLKGLGADVDGKIRSGPDGPSGRRC